MDRLDDVLTNEPTTHPFWWGRGDHSLHNMTYHSLSSFCVTKKDIERTSENHGKSLSGFGEDTNKNVPSKIVIVTIPKTKRDRTEPFSHDDPKERRDAH